MKGGSSGALGVFWNKEKDGFGLAAMCGVFCGFLVFQGGDRGLRFFDFCGLRRAFQIATYVRTDDLLSIPYHPSLNPQPIAIKSLTPRKLHSSISSSFSFFFFLSFFPLLSPFSSAFKPYLLPSLLPRLPPKSLLGGRTFRIAETSSLFYSQVE